MANRINLSKKSEGRTLAIFLMTCLVFGVFASLIYQAVLIPIAVGLVISYLLYPAVEYINQKTHVPRSIIVLGTMVLFIFIITIVTIVFAPPLYKQIVELVDLAPSAYHRFIRTWLPVLKDFLVKYKVMSAVQFDSIHESITVGADFFNTFKNTLATVWRTAPKVLSTVVSASLVPLVAYLFLQHFHEIRFYFYSLVPRKSLRPTKAILHRLNEALRGVIKGQVYVAATLGVLYVIGFSAVGLKAGAAIGIVCGIARLVPYLDIVVGILLSFIVIVSSFSGAAVAVGVGLVILIVQALDGMIITPKLIGGSAGLHPVVVICSIIAFSGLLGFAGVLIAIPTIAVLKESLKIGVAYYKQSDFYAK